MAPENLPRKVLVDTEALVAFMRPDAVAGSTIHAADRVSTHIAAALDDQAPGWREVDL